MRISSDNKKSFLERNLKFVIPLYVIQNESYYMGPSNLLEGFIINIGVFGHHLC